MIVVPVEKDLVKTADGNSYRVVSYTNFKDNGPAVYCRNRGDKSQTLIYFFDIVSINGVRVEYNKSAKMLNALGKLPREQQLPQPDDKIVVATTDGKRVVEVDSLKLKSKAFGENKGILIKAKDDNVYRLKAVVDIQLNVGGSRFSRKTFLSYYDEYTGV